jgi:tetratricopeptide (TPR) repeat protein
MKTTIIIFITFLTVIFSNTIFSQTAQGYFDKGIKHLDQKEYPLAIQSFDSVIKTELESIKAFQMRGVAKMYNEEYFGAIEDFDKAINLVPDNYKSYLFRSMANEKIGNLPGAKMDKEKAKALFKKSKEESPDYPII